MPNLKKPEGLYLKRGIWTKLCISCKRYIVRHNLNTIDNLKIFLCFKCSEVIANKRKRKEDYIKPYKIVNKCPLCKKKYEAKMFGRIYCYKCKPDTGEKN